MAQDSPICRHAIIGPVCGELTNLTIDLIEQRCRLRGIVSVLIRECMANDPATVGIHRQVQFAPVAARLRRVLDCRRGTAGAHTRPWRETDGDLVTIAFGSWDDYSSIRDDRCF
jgi:hypothetical protein